MKLIQFSLVCYDTSHDDLNRVIASINLCALPWVLTVVDNSPTNELEPLVEDHTNILYLHRPDNPGFGAAHNIAISNSINNDAMYHIIVNPDVYFDYDIVSPMVEYMIQNPGIGMMMPQVLNLDGSIQRLPKLLPSPFSIIFRKVRKPSFAYNKFINKYELREIPSNVIYDAPILSGCFTVLNLAAVKEIGMYDDRFFMYFEDWDLSRRMHVRYRTVYYPLVSIYHGYESGANKNSKLFKIFVKSAFAYFDKWGWFFDRERWKFNKKAIRQF